MRVWNRILRMELMRESCIWACRHGRFSTNLNGGHSCSSKPSYSKNGSPPLRTSHQLTLIDPFLRIEDRVALHDAILSPLAYSPPTLPSRRLRQPKTLQLDYLPQTRYVPKIIRSHVPVIIHGSSSPDILSGYVFRTIHPTSTDRHVGR